MGRAGEVEARWLSEHHLKYSQASTFLSVTKCHCLVYKWEASLCWSFQVWKNEVKWGTFFFGRKKTTTKKKTAERNTKCINVYTPPPPRSISENGALFIMNMYEAVFCQWGLGGWVICPHFIAHQAWKTFQVWQLDAGHAAEPLSKLLPLRTHWAQNIPVVSS